MNSASQTQSDIEHTLLRRTLGLPRRILMSENLVLYMSILYFLVLWMFIPLVGSLRNLENLSSNMWPLFVLAVGQMFVLIVGGIDLSQASIMGVTSVIGALLMAGKLDPVLFQKNILWGIVISESGGLLSGVPAAVPIGVAIMLLAGILIGLINGLAVAKFRMPPFMVTLVSMTFFAGLAIYLTRSENVMNLPKGYIAIGKGQLGPMPCSFFIALLLAILAHIILNRTLLGRWLYAVGKNVRASVISGVPVDLVVILAYVFSGFCGALGAVLYSARLEAGRPTLGQGLLLDIIGAVVIGGISLFGGKGKVLWALFGVLFFTLLSNSLNMLNLSFYTVDIVKGAIILLAALVDVARTRLIAKGA